jgi:hypothetical protein
MSVFSWCSRRVGGLSLIALFILCYYVISSELRSSTDGRVSQGHYHGIDHYRRPQNETGKAGNWTLFFAYYTLLMHIFVFIFPMRACWAVEDLTRGIKKVARNKQLNDFKFSHARRLSSTSLSSAETLTSSQASSASSEAGDIELGYYTDADVEQEKIIHAILIPNYKENIDDLRETLAVLAAHPQARATYDVSNCSQTSHKYKCQKWRDCKFNSSSDGHLGLSCHGGSRIKCGTKSHESCL